MKTLIVEHADEATTYVPAPCRGTVSKVTCVFQTNTVEPGDTVVVSRDATAVNTVTAVNTAGLVVETGVPDATNKGLVFDPASATATEQVMKITDTGKPGAKILCIEYDDSAYVEQSALEA
jgi:hypothetical protein